jgi:branched-chain amino acid transport system ATP-binding protein
LAGAGPPIESGIGTPARSSGDSTGESAGTNTPHGATELKAPPPHPRGFAPVGVSSRHLPSTGLPLESGVARDVRGAILLEAKGLVRSFGRFNAVDGVDLEVAPGTITGLIGPNGAGKSTLFNLIAGTLPPTAGAIQFEGSDITGLPPNRIFTLGLARTFQIPRPFPRMTVLENAMLVPLHQSGERFWSNWLAGRRVAREERAIRERAAEALGFCGLGQKLDELAGNLSGGQQKLLELARVMMIDPKLILLDEPAAGVNPALIEILIDKILELKARGVTFLIIEHNMDVVMRICRPLIVMTQGRVIARGSPDEVRNDPRVLDAYLGEATL